MTTWLLTLIAVAHGAARTPSVSDSVHWIEVNHVYSRDTAAVVFDQVIFWSRGRDGEFHVREWHRADRVTIVGDVATVTADRVTFRVRGDSVSETWTAFDPEQLDRASVPADRREKLNRYFPPSLTDPNGNKRK